MDTRFNCCLSIIIDDITYLFTLHNQNVNVDNSHQYKKIYFLSSVVRYCFGCYEYTAHQMAPTTLKVMVEKKSINDLFYTFLVILHCM